MPMFVVTVFVSAFLLFSIQPMVAKFLLPSFGGTAAVWTTCLVVFQILLLGGYAYAHLLRSKLSPIAQRWTHLGLLAFALLLLPPAPNGHLPANTTGTPVWELLRCLLASIGPPFFALSATAPLLMEWFRQSFPGRSPDRLYAFSNAGSLLALLCYPALIDPFLSRSAQAWLWAGGMALFLALCATVAWRTRHPARGSADIPVHSAATPDKRADKNVRAPLPAWLWIALPACGTGLLLALTNQLSQDVAPMPLLWVVPLSLYLLTFILCFEGPRFYKRDFFIPASFLSFLLLAWLLDEGYLQGFWVQVGGYLSVLFLGCMVCHGELYRLRPRAERLTGYYLAIALGGALGGIFVALVAPMAFKTLLETPLIAVAVSGLATFILWRESGASFRSSLAVPGANRPNRGHAGRSALAALGTLLIAASLGYVLLDLRADSIYCTRSFYGPYRVKEGPTLLLDSVDYTLNPGPARVLLSGQIYHGLQFINPAAASVPTTYYCEEGGLGVAFRALPVQTNRNIGAIGLGAGTLAAYGRQGDHIRFYELSPDVVRIARTYFTFLTNSAASVEVGLGDARLSLEREPSQGFDLMVLDAFSGDSIPMHLLTDEAMRTYQRHLKPGGVMAFHISNSHLDLEPVVRALAERHHLMAVLVPPKALDTREGKLASIWMLLSSNPRFFAQPELADLMRVSARREPRPPLLWTDDYSSILPILH